MQERGKEWRGPLARRWTGACGMAWMLAGILWAGPLFGADPQKQTDLRIVVSIPPQREMVQRIAGPDARVSVMLPPGKSPETYSPTPAQIRQLGEADVYFSIGLPFEQVLLGNVPETHPNLVVADMSAGIVRRALEEGHGDEEEEYHHHHHGEPDPHVWMAPLLLAQMAENAAVTLYACDAERSPVYQRAAVQFRQEMEELDARLRAMLAPYAGRTLFVYHPAFGYFADAYDLKQEAVEQGGSSPTPRQMAALIASARAEGVQVIFVQPEFDQAKAEVIAEAIQGRVVRLNPLAEKVTENLLHIGEAIRDAWQ